MYTEDSVCAPKCSCLYYLFANMYDQSLIKYRATLFKSVFYMYVTVTTIQWCYYHWSIFVGKITKKWRGNIHIQYLGLIRRRLTIIIRREIIFEQPLFFAYLRVVYFKNKKSKKTFGMQYLPVSIAHAGSFCWLFH